MLEHIHHTGANDVEVYNFFLFLTIHMNQSIKIITELIKTNNIIIKI